MKKTRKPLSQTVIVLFIVLARYGFFYLMSPSFRKYTTFLNIMDFSYYIVLMAIGVTFPLITGGVDLSNLEEYLSFDKVQAVGGTFLLKGDIRANTAALVEKLK